MENNNDNTHLVNTNEEHTREDSNEEEIFADFNDNTIPEEELETFTDIFFITYYQQQ